MTLIELVITISVIAIALAGTLQVFVSTNRNSVDPLIYQQQIAVAEAYLSEILAKSPAVVGMGCPEATPRSDWTLICSYTQLAANATPADQEGNVFNVDGGGTVDLSPYGVTVAITNDGTASFGTGTGQVTGLLPSGDPAAVRVDVTVRFNPLAKDLVLSGYRINRP